MYTNANNAELPGYEHDHLIWGGAPFQNAHLCLPPITTNLATDHKKKKSKEYNDKL